jgi:hypothetical protein
MKHEGSVSYLDNKQWYRAVEPDPDRPKVVRLQWRGSAGNSPWLALSCTSITVHIPACCQSSFCR